MQPLRQLSVEELHSHADTVQVKKRSSLEPFGRQRMAEQNCDAMTDDARRPKMKL